MFSLTLVVLISLLDWFRGMAFPKYGGALKKLLLGSVMGLALGLSGLWLLAGAILIAASFAIGWGGPLGASLGNHDNMSRTHYWQVGKYLKTHAKASMYVRGFISALFLLPLMYVNPWIGFALIWFPIAFTLPTYATGHWEHYEIMRGLLLGIFCVCI